MRANRYIHGRSPVRTVARDIGLGLLAFALGFRLSPLSFSPSHMLIRLSRIRFPKSTNRVDFRVAYDYHEFHFLQQHRDRVVSLCVSCYPMPFPVHTLRWGWVGRGSRPVQRRVNLELAWSSSGSVQDRGSGSTGIRMFIRPRISWTSSYSDLSFWSMGRGTPA